MTALDTLRVRLEAAKIDALRVYELDKGKPSGAFDAGRYDALKQALEILDEPSGLGLGKNGSKPKLRINLGHPKDTKNPDLALLAALEHTRDPGADPALLILAHALEDAWIELDRGR
jgi:type II restriction/modification system DNA methylase subunit YeeA